MFIHAQCYDDDVVRISKGYIGDDGKKQTTYESQEIRAGKRIAACVDIQCDDNAVGRDRASKLLEDLLAELKEESDGAE